MNDFRLRLFGYPLVILLSAWVFHGEELLTGPAGLARGLATSTLFTVVLWEGNRWIFLQARRRFPGYARTASRLVVESIASVAYSVLVQVLLEALLYAWEQGATGWGLPIDWWRCVLISLVPLVLMAAIYESVYFFEQWRDNIRRSEALARAHVQAQFDALKKQLDPHFLFNSLNTLAYLIDLENEPAQAYLARLAKVYRYVLDTRQRATVSLADELAFLDDYLYLNQVRFQENLQVERQLSPASYGRHVPALSLQLLVENAIKHNVVSQESPLRIRILEDGMNISVVNSKQARSSLAPSTRVGLANLRAQYRLLTSRPIVVLDEAATFTVRLPLLEA